MRFHYVFIVFAILGNSLWAAASCDKMLTMNAAVDFSQEQVLTLEHYLEELKSEYKKSMKLHNWSSDELNHMALMEGRKKMKPKEALHHYRRRTAFLIEFIKVSLFGWSEGSPQPKIPGCCKSSCSNCPYLRKRDAKSPWSLSPPKKVNPEILSQLVYYRALFDLEDLLPEKAFQVPRSKKKFKKRLKEIL